MYAGFVRSVAEQRHDRAAGDARGACGDKRAAGGAQGMSGDKRAAGGAQFCQHILCEPNPSKKMTTAKECTHTHIHTHTYMVVNNFSQCTQASGRKTRRTTQLHEPVLSALPPSPQQHQQQPLQIGAESEEGTPRASNAVQHQQQQGPSSLRVQDVADAAAQVGFK
eukprot:1147155-Pelagomonas_calceolata.AAC.11